MAALEQRLDGRIDSLGTKTEAMEQRILATMRGEPNGMLLKMFALVVGLCRRPPRSSSRWSL